MLEMIDVLFGFWCILFSGAICLRIGVFDSIFRTISSVIPWTKPRIVVLSVVTSVLPVPGRIAVSAPILAASVSKDTDKDKLSTINYWSSHFWYLFSPMEKSIILTASLAGVTYSSLILSLIPAVIVLSLVGLVCLYRMDFKEYANASYVTTYTDKATTMSSILAFSVALFVMFKYNSIAAGMAPCLAISVVYAFVINKNAIRDSLPDSDKIWFLGFVIAAAAMLKSELAGIDKWLIHLGICPSMTVPFVLVVAFLAGLITGSSSKMTAIGTLVAVTLLNFKSLSPLHASLMLASVYMAEYAGYLLSPMHKCIHITKQHFDASYKKLYIGVGLMAIVSILCSIAYAISTHILK